MKVSKIVLVLGLLVTAIAGAEEDRIFQNPPLLKPEGIRTLSCGNNTQSFSVTLDSRTFDPGSGLYVPTEARIRDNFFTSDEMICVGARVSEIKCIGYVNGTPSLIEAQVIRVIGNRAILTYSMVRGHGPSNRLNCELSE
jgi:hypothetical protein